MKRESQEGCQESAESFKSLVWVLPLAFPPRGTLQADKGGSQLDSSALF